jgi:hypothetical protein
MAVRLKMLVKSCCQQGKGNVDSSEAQLRAVQIGFGGYAEDLLVRFLSYYLIDMVIFQFKSSL